MKTVRLRRPFLALLPVSGPPGSSLPRRCSSSGRWGEAEPPCSPEPAASSAEPSPEQPRGASGNLKTAAGSAFRTAAGESGRESRAAPGAPRDGLRAAPAPSPAAAAGSRRALQPEAGSHPAILALPAETFWNRLGARAA